MKYLTIITLSILFFSCSNHSEKGGATISGKITNVKNQTVYLEKFVNAIPQLIDSTVLEKDGDFSFTEKVEEIAFYRIKIAEDKFISLVVDSNSKIQITADANHFDNYVVAGSDDSKLLKDINQYLKESFSKIDSLSFIYQSVKEKGVAVQDSISKTLQEPYNKIIAERITFVKKFIEQHPQSIATLTIINFLSPDSNYTSYKNLDKILFEKYPASDYVKDFHAKVAELSKLAVGTEAPEIILNAPDGNPIKLSSLRGKIVLLDFWASWCPPCRKEMPNVKRLYEKFHNKGFEIYGVSLDKEKEAWLTAIKADKLTWTQVSDLQYWNSAVVKLYNIEGIPFTLLLDKNGVIIAKGLLGEELENKLTQLLK